MTVRSKIAVLAAEFLGTAVLATVAINISRSQIGISYFVAIGVGLALGLLVLALGRTSGAHLNPAVTIGLWTVRKISTINAIAYVAVQMLAGLVAWQLASYFTGSDLQSMPGLDQFDWKILVAEAIGAFVFTFAVAAAVYQYEDLEEGKKAALIGGGLFLGVIVASLASNAILNPAVALANQSWSKAYAFGPVIGGVIGFNLYVLLFAPISALLPSRAKAEVAAPAVVKKPAKVTTSKTAVAKKTATKKPAAQKTTRKTTKKK